MSSTRSCCRGGVEESGHGALDVVLPREHGARRETPVHELAALRVHRVVEADDRRVGRQVGSVAALDAIGVDEDVLRLLDLDDVVVAGDAPELVLGVPVDRRVVAHPRVGGVRIAGVEVAVEEVDHPVDGVGRCHAPGSFRASITSHPTRARCTR